MSLSDLKDSCIGRIQSSSTLKELEDSRVHIFGKTGTLTQALKELSKTIKTLDNEAKKAQGQMVNEIKKSLKEAFDNRRKILSKKAMEEKLQSEKVDVTLPCSTVSKGGIHPITKTIFDIKNYFSKLGFDLREAGEMEDDYHNFTALNIPEDHPARQDHDTFYLESGKVLRTHTSNTQIRTFESEKPPFRFLSPGRVYRYDYDATHTPMFHQIEGVLIDKNITMANLKATIIDFLSHFFDVKDLPVRFRPSFFPFTTPSAEVDIGCSKKDGQLIIGGGDDWMEILGCGMVHPNVLKMSGINPDEWQGFAFGMGIERMAMLKHGIADIRSLYDGDDRWLSHYAFGGFDL